MIIPRSHKKRNNRSVVALQDRPISLHDFIKLAQSQGVSVPNTATDSFDFQSAEDVDLNADLPESPNLYEAAARSMNPDQYATKELGGIDTDPNPGPTPTPDPDQE